MNKIAVFPGSFDPITKGHESIIKRAIPIFDKIIVAVGVNSEKAGYFAIEKRLKWINQVFKAESRIEVTTYSGLTVDFCKKVNARFILRGLRTSADFEFERAIAQTNKSMLPDVETVFMLTTPELTPINSTIVRDIIKNGGDASRFIPQGINLTE
ncbi:MAG: pantetheine-phosphate adenylyltransferase [Bacteroidetes bacterium HGW-Bacteroidetes-21]|nr:MAG: pantetheine-phosphate adenylyltransferase [Bacteroidetes bacterium HGW-Bacteroidetes-21]